MKRIKSLLWITFFLAIAAGQVFNPAPASALTTYNCDALTGGGSRDLDSIAVASLSDGDRAMCAVSENNENRLYYFEFQAAATDAERTTQRPYRIRPDDYSSAGVWYEQLTYPSISTQINLLGPYAEFGVWSNSGDMYTTAGTAPANNDTYAHDTETCDDDAADDESVDWSETGSGTITYAASTHYVFNGSAANEYVHSAADFTAFTAGVLYELSITLADAATAQTIQIGTFTTAAGAFTALGADITTTGSEVAHTRVFEAVGTERRIGFKVTSNPGGANNVHWTDTKLHNATPGTTATDALGPDGWTKTSTLDAFRQHADSTFTTDGSYYSAKVKKGANGAEYLYRAFDTLGQYVQFLNRIMTHGSQAYSVTATDNVKLAIYHNGAWSTVSSFAGADAWEWQELTQTINSSSTDVRFGWLFDGDSGDVAYVQIPIATFGSHIGAGNYVPSQDKIIWLDKNPSPVSTILTPPAGPYATTTWNPLNLESDFRGIIPKGVKAIYVTATMRDSNSTGGGAASLKIGKVNPAIVLRIDVDEEVDNVNRYAAGWVPCDSNGDIVVNLVATGTTAYPELQIIGVELR